MSTILSNVVSRNLLFCTALCGAIASGYAEKSITLKTVSMARAPVIEKKILRLNIDFVFDQCPQEYWLHYDKEKGRLVIEFFGFNIDAPPLAIQDTSVVKDLIVSNNETNIALNKQSAQISMVMQGDWHYESWVIKGKILRLQLWMPYDLSKALKGRKNRFVLPMVLTTFVLAALTYLIIDAVR